MVHMASGELIQLNVGGQIYTTTKATLERHPNTMLGAMFNGSMPTAVDDNGHYFIDRDGALFGYVLNFLRSSKLAVPEDFKQWEQLALEADFYQIEPLIQAIQDIRHRAKQPSQGWFLEVIEVRTGSTATMPTNNSRVKTIISGRKSVITSLPSQFIGPVEKLRHTNDSEYSEVELSGSNVRLKLAEYLQSCGWTLLDSNMTSSSGYDSKSMISSLIIEQSYRDRWFIPQACTVPPGEPEHINENCEEMV
jgi:hypothetical protein